MANTSRHHHYIPQLYLAGFTRDGTIKSQLTVIDKVDRKRFKTVPRNVGGERDFNRVDIPGLPIDAVEKALSEFETQLDGVIKRVIGEKALPKVDTEDFSVIMHFIALLGIRNPRLRTNINLVNEQISKMILHQIVATPERWEGIMQQMKHAGKKMPEETTYEKMKRFVEEDRYRVTTANESHISIEFQVAKDVLPILFRRKWSLIVAKEGAGEFVSSDRPVAITRYKPLRNDLFDPGFGSFHTELTLPLNRELAILGTFEGRSKRKKAKLKDVADINGRTIRLAEQRIYYSGNEFNYIDVDSKIYKASSLYES